ncbi:MAG: carbohydrate ABC transporter permease [Eubacteriales bacterium]|jgi:raffinose/stachyose/melibiose transport system permease protein|nr:carbohydrate ABC transporter permease [Eubacteriales bacterium]MDD3504149.1 carbohydrate ABC transporter permease [Eubacteriales bacterium]MDD4681916.1 carbohydrate ABC transporter permease [Eubacteriales bacterium]
MAEKVYGMTTGRRVGNGVLTVVMNTIMIIFSLSCIFPLVWMFYSSLKVKREFNADIIGLPPNPTFENYAKILTNKDYHIADSLINSVRTTALSVALILLFGFVVGYILARVKFRGNRVIWIMLLMGMLIPVHSLLVPIYIVFNRTGMNNQWYTLLFPYIAFGMPIAVFLIHGYLKAVPVALEEAASIDGSSFSGTLFKIIMPICKPVMVTIAIIQTFACWNEFSFALVLLRDVGLHTVPLAMTQFTGQFSSDYPKIMSAMLITMAPIVVLYFGFSKNIIKGMVAGVVKG